MSELGAVFASVWCVKRGWLVVGTVKENTVTQEIIPIDQEGFEAHRAISHDPCMRRLLSMARQVAQRPSTVLLSGESGVGKEIMARFIHRASPRAEKPFVPVNCAALPSSLLESELFGHERGAFSGAVARHQGIFERANGGTILLDEISEVSLEMQAKLLRVIQERSMFRVGGANEITLDVRLIATTNRNLRECVDAGQFRLDLYYRLNVFPLRIPALRDRPGDIEHLTRYHLGRLSRQFGGSLVGVERGAIERLRAYSFPGNVRELVNILERATILAGDSSVVTAEHLILEAEGYDGSQGLIADTDPEPTADALADELSSPDGELMNFLPGSEPLTDVRRRIIIGTLQRFDGNRTRTAEALGVSLRTIRNKLRDYRDRGIDVPEPDRKK